MISKILFSLMVIALSNMFACSSDFDCGMGNSCVKKAFQSEGVCMKNVDEYGIQQYNMPNLDSFGTNIDTDGQCDFDTDCPISFKCNREYKVCVKR